MQVTDFNNHRVQVYTKLGKYTATIGSGQASYKTGEFRNPAGISVDSGAKCDNKAGYLCVPLPRPAASPGVPLSRGTCGPSHGHFRFQDHACDCQASTLER